MARKRTRKPKLPKLLDNASDLVAFVDGDFEVLYANESCCNWLGIPEEKLVGSILKYSSTADRGPANSRNGICPSPEFFDASVFCSKGHVFSCDGDDPKWRQASFIQIVDTESEVEGVFVVAFGPDLICPANQQDEKQIAAHELIAHLLSIDKKIYSSASLVGISDQAKKLRRQVEAISKNQSDYLVIGNRGTGREHLARTIFHERNFSDARLVPVHCAIADSQLIQDSIKDWVFEQRNERTMDWLLLLDVDQLSTEAQTELLGYAQMPNFNLRIAATSTLDLSSPRQIQDFNSSLAAHLSVQTIQLDDLKNRMDDIPLLAQFMLESINHSSEKQISGLSNEVNELFFEYHWKRNIAELRMVVDAAHDSCSGSRIQANDLPDSFHHAIKAIRIGTHAVEKIDLDDYLATTEKELIRRALHQARNNKTKAAELLGINRAKLIRRTAALGLSPTSQETEQDTKLDASVFKEADEQ